MKKRIGLLLSVVAVMVVMLASSVAPAFAKQQWSCVRLDPRDSQLVNTKDEKNALEAQGYVCEKLKKPKMG